jgi:hypothetical protein
MTVLNRVCAAPVGNVIALIAFVRTCRLCILMSTCVSTLMAFETVSVPMTRNTNMACLLTSEVRVLLLLVAVKSKLFLCLAKCYVTKTLSGIYVGQRLHAVLISALVEVSRQLTSRPFYPRVRLRVGNQIPVFPVLSLVTTLIELAGSAS